jgi:hypothetical protein
VDRVDRWLNAQRGWRRTLIAWLYLAPMLLDFGLMWSAYGNLDNGATVPAGSVLVHVAIVGLAGIPLSAVLAGLQRWSAKSRPWAPLISWRVIIAVYLYVGGMCAQAYGMTRTLVWRHQHISYKMVLLSGVVAGVLLIWNLLYYRRLRRRAEAEAKPVAS